MLVPRYPNTVLLSTRNHFTGMVPVGAGTTVSYSQYSTPCCHLDTKFDKRPGTCLTRLPVLTSCARMPMPWQTYSTTPTTIVLGNNSYQSSG